MRRDHRPFYLKKIYLKFQEFYVNHFLRPQLEHLGTGFTFMKPWHVELFGAPIELGDCVNVVASSDKKVRLAIWSDQKGKGRIQIGSYCLICPGVRIGAADEITVGDNCMIASNAYITDSYIGNSGCKYGTSTTAQHEPKGAKKFGSQFFR